DSGFHHSSLGGQWNNHVLPVARFRVLNGGPDGKPQCLAAGVGCYDRNLDFWRETNPKGNCGIAPLRQRGSEPQECFGIAARPRILAEREPVCEHGPMFAMSGSQGKAT